MNHHANYSDAIENLQRYLRQLSFWNPEIPAPPIDGIWESRTEAALRAFQRLQGLPTTGVADQNTWNLLYDEYRISLAEHSPPNQILVFPFDPEGYMLTPDSIGFAVSSLQYMLRELHYHYSRLQDLEMTGIYDAPTVTAVKDFQEKNQLFPDGNTGLLTWNAIADQYNTLFSNTQDE